MAHRVVQRVSIPLLASSLFLTLPAWGAPPVEGGAPEARAQALTTCDPGASGPSAQQTVAIGGWRVDVDSGTGAWAVRRAGGPAVLSSPGTCVDEGGAAEPAVRVARGQPFALRGFGAWRTSMTGAASHQQWFGPTGAPPQVQVSAAEVVLSWALEDSGLGTVELAFSLFEGRDLEVALRAESTAITSGEIAFSCGPDDAFFGLGSQVTGMDLRGHTYPLWTQEQGIGKFPHGGLWPLNNTLEAAYAPMGVLHSTAGFSAVVGHDGYFEVDLCEAAPTRSHVRSFPFLPKFVLVAGQTPKDRLTAITDYTGRMSEPPAWTFAPWNDAVGGPDRLWEVATTLRSNGIPSSAIWSEDWIGEDPTPFGFGLSYAWEWDPQAYPDLPRDVHDLHREGFAFLGYFNSFVPSTTRMWDEGKEGGYLIENDKGRTYSFLDPFFRQTSLVDLTNPDAVDWLQSYLLTAADEVGLDGWMADFSEWLPEDAVMASGESGWRAHNRYPVDWQRANREMLDYAHASGIEAANNWTFFSRSGWASINGGTAGAAPTLWAGDQNTDWGYNDGYPTVVPIGTHLGLSGVGVFGHDIAGYTTVMTRPTNKELFWRWAMLGAFSPLMRTHHGLGECDNWAFDRDEETLLHFKRYASLHTMLFPYLWARAQESMQEGLPIMRHPWLVEPEVPALWQGDDYLYFLGDALLVAPILAEGQSRRTVEMPGDGWWPLLGNRPVDAQLAGDGLTWQTVAQAGAGEIPVYVRPGTVLPLLGELVDSFYGATATGVTDLSDVSGHWAVGLYPDAAGGVGPESFSDVTISGDGLGASVDWRQATVNGAAVGLCPSGQATQTCALADGSALEVFSRDAVIKVGQAEVIVEAQLTGRFRFAVAGLVWGSVAAPTPLTDLDPDVPPPCEQ